jgi:hypothetical protein
MIDSHFDVARRLRHTARINKIANRYWAGWKLSLTFGPYEQAFEPWRAAGAKAMATEIFEQVHGKPAPDDNPSASAALQRNRWHLSASWRGNYPAADGKHSLQELIVAIGVPEAERAGIQPIRMMLPDGSASPQVTHWIWREQ